jgi:hypothetical protein
MKSALGTVANSVKKGERLGEARRIVLAGAHFRRKKPRTG